MACWPIFVCRSEKGFRLVLALNAIITKIVDIDTPAEDARRHMARGRGAYDTSSDGEDMFDMTAGPPSDYRSWDRRREVRILFFLSLSFNL